MVAYMVIWECHPNVMSLIGHTQFTPRLTEQIVYSLLAKVDHIEVHSTKVTPLGTHLRILS
jgi:hypothetical protein